MPRPKVYRERVEALDVITSLAPETLDDCTYDELYHLAQERNIGGRSSMSKEQLVKALS